MSFKYLVTWILISIVFATKKNKQTMHREQISQKFMQELYAATKCDWSYETMGSWGGDTEVDKKLGPIVAVMTIYVPIPDPQIENLVKTQYVEIRQKNNPTGHDLTIHVEDYSWKWGEFHQFVQKIQEITI